MDAYFANHTNIHGVLCPLILLLLYESCFLTFLWLKHKTISISRIYFTMIYRAMAFSSNTSPIYSVAILPNSIASSVVILPRLYFLPCMLNSHETIHNIGYFSFFLKSFNISLAFNLSKKYKR